MLSEINQSKTNIVCYHLYVEYKKYSQMKRTKASQMALVVKNPPANAGDGKRHRFNPWVGKIPLEEGMAVHSSILA